MSPKSEGGLAQHVAGVGRTGDRWHLGPRFLPIGMLRGGVHIGPPRTLGSEGRLGACTAAGYVRLRWHDSVGCARALRLRARAGTARRMGRYQLTGWTRLHNNNKLAAHGADLGEVWCRRHHLLSNFGAAASKGAGWTTEFGS